MSSLVFVLWYVGYLRKQLDANKVEEYEDWQCPALSRTSYADSDPYDRMEYYEENKRLVKKTREIADHDERKKAEKSLESVFNTSGVYVARYEAGRVLKKDLHSLPVKDWILDLDKRINGLLGEVEQKLWRDELRCDDIDEDDYFMPAEELDKLVVGGALWDLENLLYKVNKYDPGKFIQLYSDPMDERLTQHTRDIMLALKGNILSAYEVKYGKR